LTQAKTIGRITRAALVGASVVVAAFAGFAAVAPASESSTAAAAVRPQPQTKPLAAPRELEVELIGRINALRTSEHLPPLREDRPDLTEMARSWAAQMAKDGGISHRTDLTTAAPADWVHVGENVGVGGTVASLHQAFVASPLHHKNLVDPDFESIGVGIVVVDGRIWVAENFLKAAPAGTTPVADTVELHAPPGGLGKRTCVTRRCTLTLAGRIIAFTRL
jgi:uncharacterized protein YkwD